jgi:hypothetical protein
MASASVCYSSADSFGGREGDVGQQEGYYPTSPTSDLRSRLSLSPSNGTIPRLSFHIRRLLVILSAPHLTLQPRTLHNLPKPTHCFLNRLPLTQHDLDCHNSSPGTTPPYRKQPPNYTTGAGKQRSCWSSASQLGWGPSGRGGEKPAETILEHLERDREEFYPHSRRKVSKKVPGGQIIQDIRKKPRRYALWYKGLG